MLKIEFRNFRNVISHSLDCPQDLTFFIGSNAQGKTSILESLYVLSFGKSYRTRSHKELIQFGKSIAQLKAQIKKDEQLLRLEIQLNDKGKKVKRNGLEIVKLSQYIGTLPVVLFAPEDLAIVKGNPQVRRRFLDMEIGQVSPIYLYNLTKLKLLLTQRNSLLKQMAQKKEHTGPLLDILDEQLITLSIQIWRKRVHFLELLTKCAQEIHQRITRDQEELVIKYITSFPMKKQMDDKTLEQLMCEELKKIRDKEIVRGNSLLGPHRDDFRLMIGELDLHLFGSQGQQRTAALSLKLAELELIYREIGYYPVLLLDDVLSELDEMRRTHLLKSIEGRVQTFVTTTSLDGINKEIIQKAQIYLVQQGKIQKE